MHEDYRWRGGQGQTGEEIALSSLTPAGHRPRNRVVTDINGTGIGLRSPHIREVLETLPEVPWFEVLMDNHTAKGGRIAHELLAIREHYPFTLHCVGLSLGGNRRISTMARSFRTPCM